MAVPGGTLNGSGFRQCLVFRELHGQPAMTGAVGERSNGQRDGKSRRAERSSVTGEPIEEKGARRGYGASDERHGAQVQHFEQRDHTRAAGSRANEIPRIQAADRSPDTRERHRHDHTGGEEGEGKDAK